MPGAVHCSSFMSQLQYSSVSLINSYDSITVAKGMVEVERFLVPLGKSQERLKSQRAGECKLPEEKQQHWQELSEVLRFIHSVWQQFSRQQFNPSRWSLAGCRLKVLAEASSFLLFPLCTSWERVVLAPQRITSSSVYYIVLSALKTEKIEQLIQR